MVFKIKHEKRSILIAALVCTLLFFLFLFIGLVPFLWASSACGAIAGICALLYFIEQAVGTAIVIEDRTIIIKHLLGWKKIAVESIYNLDIERYKRYRRGHGHYIEYRMRLTINLLSGKKLVLTDKAMAVNSVAGFLLSRREELPDEEVELYKAYLAIRQRCVKYNHWQVNEAVNSDLSERF